MSAYWHDLPEPARETLRALSDLPLGSIEQRGGFFYLSRIIAPGPGNGFHPRLARGFMQWTGGRSIGFFAPRRAAKWRVADFEATDISILVNSAAQGDVVFFRSHERSAMESVVRFFRKSFLITEGSSGDS